MSAALQMAVTAKQATSTPAHVGSALTAIKVARGAVTTPATLERNVVCR
jgi:hypothetical protein